MFGKQAQPKPMKNLLHSNSGLCMAYVVRFVFIVRPTRESLVAIVRLDGVDDGVGARHFVPRHGGAALRLCAELAPDGVAAAAAEAAPAADDWRGSVMGVSG